MQSFPVAGEKSRTSLKSIVETLFRQKRVFGLAFAGALALAMLLIFGPHKKYGSDMSLLVQNARGTDLVTAGPTNGMPIIRDVSDEQMNSEAAILTSKDVLDDVVDPGWTKVSPYDRTPAQLATHDASVYYLLKHLDVTPIKKSHIIQVTLKARDPRQATGEMTRLLDVFMAKQRDLQRPAGASSFFADEAKRYEKQWEDAKAKLTAYEQARQLTNPHDQETLLDTQLTDANTQLRAVDAQIAELTKRVQADEKAVNSIPQRQDTVQRKVPDEGYIDNLNNTLVQLTNEKTELLTKYQPTDRLVKQVDEQIASIKQSLAESQTNNFQEASTNINPTWQAADESLSEKRAELQAAQGRRASLALQASQLERQLSATEGSELGYASLQHAVTDAENNYQLYTQKRDASEIADAMDAHALLNVSVVQSPTYSLDPVFPKPLLDSCLAVFSALFIAVFAVFLAESGRQTFATPRELELASGYPVLATVPLNPLAAAGGDPAILSPSARVSILTAVGSRAASAARSAARSSMLRLW